MKNKLIIVFIVAVLVGLHLLPLIPPNIPLPNASGIDNPSVEKANNLYESASYNEAIKYYYLLAQKGETYSQYKLGYMYLHGQGIKPDLCEATYWFDQAARSGNGYGQFQMGVAYHDGYGVERDNIQTYLWMHAALNTLSQNGAKEKILDGIKKQFDSIQSELDNTNELTQAKNQSESWKSQEQAPAKIIRLRGIAVFDQLMRKIYNTLPCDILVIQN